MDKLHALTHYIISKCENPVHLGATKLNKILWFTDALSFIQTGKSITNADYEKRQFGPVPKNIMTVKSLLKERNYIFEREGTYNGYPQKQFVSLAHPDISEFSAEEISLIDGVIKEICENHTAVSISEKSHDIIWDAAQIGEEIPMYAVLASRQGELSGSDMNWGKSQAMRLGLTHDA